MVSWLSMRKWSSRKSQNCRRQKNGLLGCTWEWCNSFGKPNLCHLHVHRGERPLYGAHQWSICSESSGNPRSKLKHPDHFSSHLCLASRRERERKKSLDFQGKPPPKTNVNKKKGQAFKKKIPYCNILKQNPASSQVLVFQKFFSLIPFLLGALQEKTGEFRQSNIIPVKIHPLQNKEH